jgi:hypothetical protein
MIKYIENIIRFVEEREKLGITSKTKEDEFCAILKKSKYDRFNKPLLLNPRYTKTTEL